MDIRPSKRLDQLLTVSCAAAQGHATGQVCLDGIFLTLLREGNSHATHILGKLLRDWEFHQIQVRIERELAQQIRESGQPDDESIRRDILSRFEAVCALPGLKPGVGNTGHLLLAVLLDRGLISSRILEMHNIQLDKVLEYVVQLPFEEDFYENLRALENLSNVRIEIRNIGPGQPSNHQSEPDPDASDYEPDGSAGDEDEESLFPAPRKRKSGKSLATLDKHAVNLTAMAAAGEIDPVVGREAEIERLIQILGRRKKNNPILIGEAGVGKSAIVEGFALRIASREVPHSLREKMVYSLDVASLVAGTKYRGEFEERIKSLLKELAANRDVILFIDEIHTIAGAGSTQGSLDTANILKPALARGEVQCIGATTLDEYRESIESDSALERRFQKILVEPTTREQTREILQNIKSHYERHHFVRYTDEALDACVELTDRYITDRHFPDKAIDVLDEAGSKAHVFHAKTPAGFEELEARIAQTAAEKRAAIDRKDYARAAEIRLREITQRSRLAEEIDQWQRTLSANPVVVTAEHIGQVITLMTGIPVERVSQGEQARLQEMETFLGSVVVGQGDAVAKVTKSILRSRAGLKDPEKPIGVFMFVGPTGVGKTHLAKELSKWMFDKRDALIRIDMSEYAEKHNVSRLIGSPPGYVGYGEGGQLTEAVRRQPYAVVLFDEIEKAHPDVFNVMLQIFDDGQLTDGLGRKVDFRNTIIIMTSNVGSRVVAQRPSAVGYNTSSKPENERVNKDSDYRRALESTFAPEFINRIDDIVVFNTLTGEHIGRIVDLELRGLCERVSALGYRIEIKPAAKRCLAQQGYESRYGVRSLKRTILELIEEPLARMIVEGKLAKGSLIEIGSADRKIELLSKTAV